MQPARLRHLTLPTPLPVPSCHPRAASRLAVRRSRTRGRPSLRTATRCLPAFPSPMTTKGTCTLLSKPRRVAARLCRRAGSNLDSLAQRVRAFASITFPSLATTPTPSRTTTRGWCAQRCSAARQSASPRMSSARCSGAALPTPALLPARTLPRFPSLREAPWRTRRRPRPVRAWMPATVTAMAVVVVVMMAAAMANLVPTVLAIRRARGRAAGRRQSPRSLRRPGW